MEGKFVTKSDLLKMEDRKFISQSAADSEGNYKTYWAVNGGDRVHTVQNLFI